MYSANALMHISTWCMSLVSQRLFYSFFLFIRMSVHLSCMSIDCTSRKIRLLAGNTFDTSQADYCS